MKAPLLRSLLAAVSAVLLVMTSPTIAQAQDAWEPDPDLYESIGFRVDYNNGRDLILIEEDGERTFAATFHVTNDRTFTLCEDPGEKLDCGVAEPGYVRGAVILPFCGEVNENCIEGLTIGKEEPKPATYAGSAHGFGFKGVPSKGIPSGSGPSYFDSETAHSNGNRYAVVATAQFGIRQDQGDVFEFTLRVFPVVERPSTYVLPYAKVCNTNDGKGLGPCLQHNDLCVYQTISVCAYEQQFSEGTKLGVTMRLSKSVTGWFRGRIKDPQISVDSLDAQYSRVSISGETVAVPRLLTSYEIGKDGPDIVGPPSEGSHGGAFTIFRSASSRAIEIVNGVRSRTKDVATGTSTIWSINSIEGAQAGAGSDAASRCLSDTSRLLGIVTTNAMAFTGTVPSYQSGYLGYKVAGLHYLEDGKTLAEGTYDLVMRSDVARCIYGFSKAPVSATIQVVGTSGVEKVASTVVSEKDGWLKLAAYGFTFSEKEVRVTITQQEPVVPVVNSPAKTITKLLAKFSAKSVVLSASQKKEINAVMKSSPLNTKFICTGNFVKPAEKALALSRARAACNYAKSRDPGFSYVSQALPTKTANLNGRVTISSK
jgi:hypothetical protein